MVLKTNLMQNYSENSLTANSSLLSPTGGVKSISPIQENSYDENDDNNMSDETKVHWHHLLQRDGACHARRIARLRGKLHTCPS